MYALYAHTVLKSGDIEGISKWTRTNSDSSYIYTICSIWTENRYIELSVECKESEIDSRLYIMYYNRIFSNNSILCNCRRWIP